VSDVLVYITMDEASQLRDSGYIEWSDNDNKFVTTGAGDGLIRGLLKDCGVLK
jgi:hypothetical protein